MVLLECFVLTTSEKLVLGPYWILLHVFIGILTYDLLMNT